MLETLRREVLDANLELVRQGLVLYTFGNASGIARREGLVVIKPSGVPYDSMRPADLVITDLNGRVVEGRLRPTSDLATHLVLYRKFPSIGGVVHTHSRYATAWAQAGREIPCFGTTHADYFRGCVPVTAPLDPHEIEGDYEANTGHAIVRRFCSLDPDEYPAVLVAGHGPFCWGASAGQAAHHAVILEYLAHMAYSADALNPRLEPLPVALVDRHFLRKHGAAATYGQKIASTLGVVGEQTMACKVSIRQVGNVAVADLSGRITLGDGSGVVRETVRGLIDKGQKNILLNLGGVSYIDSAGLGELVGGYATVTNQGGQIKLLNVQTKVRDVLQVTKLYTVFEVFTDEATAVRSFKTQTASA